MTIEKSIIHAVNYPDFSDPFYMNYARLLCSSYERWTGKPLLSAQVKVNNPAQALFDAPFVLVSHGTEKDSIFNFGNHAALKLFEMEWDDFIRLPSRKSADEENREDRARLMARVSADGYATGCTGVRISSSGRRFLITGATVWNMVDEQDRYHGQAAMFTDWKYLTVQELEL
ncbi:MAG: MEKHLA domain-containing protein [Gammaproteobacteria bacterium]